MKSIKIILLVIVGVMLVGCSSKNETKTCTIKSDQSTNGYKQNTKYIISIKKDLVYKVQQIDTIESKKKDIIEFYKNEYNNLNKNNNKKYNGYTFNVKASGNKVISDCTIDYNKFDRNKYVNDNSGLKKYVNKDNYFTKDGIIKMYENLGATCK